MATSQQPAESCDVDQLPDPKNSKPFFTHPRNHQRFKLSTKSIRRKPNSHPHQREHQTPDRNPSFQPTEHSFERAEPSSTSRQERRGSTPGSAEAPNHPAAASGLSCLQSRWDTRDEAAAAAGSWRPLDWGRRGSPGRRGIRIADLRKPGAGVVKWNQRRMGHPPPRREKEAETGEDSRPWNSQGQCAGVFYSPRRPAADSSSPSPPFGSCSRPHLALLTEGEGEGEGERETEQTFFFF